MITLGTIRYRSMPLTSFRARAGRWPLEQALDHLPEHVGGSDDAGCVHESRALEAPEFCIVWWALLVDIACDGLRLRQQFAKEAVIVLILRLVR